MRDKVPLVRLQPSQRVMLALAVPLLLLVIVALVGLQGFMMIERLVLEEYGPALEELKDRSEIAADRGGAAGVKDFALVFASTL
ncbi:MAG: hypothetical protein AB1896_06625, partial [Thermodesulfobacteriota bacterium]